MKRHMLGIAARTGGNAKTAASARPAAFRGYLRPSGMRLIFSRTVALTTQPDPGPDAIRLGCNRSGRVGTTMNHATRLTVLTAALVLAASSAHAFTVGDQGNTGTYRGSYGSTLTDPGDQARNFGSAGTLDLSTPGTNSTSNSQMGGFSFRYGAGAGSVGSDTNRRLAPPAWSTDPLYLER